jgi:hypothetical protein
MKLHILTTTLAVALSASVFAAPPTPSTDTVSPSAPAASGDEAAELAKNSTTPSRR